MYIKNYIKISYLTEIHYKHIHTIKIVAIKLKHYQNHKDRHN